MDSYSQFCTVVQILQGLQRKITSRGRALNRGHLPLPLLSGHLLADTD